MRDKKNKTISKLSKSVSTAKSKIEIKKGNASKNGNKKISENIKKKGVVQPETKIENKIINKTKIEKSKKKEIPKKLASTRQVSPLIKKQKDLNTKTVEKSISRNKNSVLFPKNGKNRLKSKIIERAKNEINLKGINSQKSINSNRTLNTAISRTNPSNENSLSNILTKPIISPDQILLTGSKSKETLSTYVETLSTEETIKNEPSKKGNNLLAKNIVLLNNKKKNNNEQTVLQRYYQKKKESEKCILSELTPIPVLKNKHNENIEIESKEMHNAKMLRRLEYNDYIKELNKPKQKMKPRPKVYNKEKVNRIQRIYKGFRTRDINQVINRLRINLCAVELFCLILSQIFDFASKRLSFYVIKLYYFDPFSLVANEVDFLDKINMRLADKYYSFNNFRITKVKQKIFKRQKYRVFKKSKTLKKKK